MMTLWTRLRRRLAGAGDRLGLRLRRSFYLYLALLFTVAVLADAVTGNRIVGVRQSAFDAMVRHRLVVAPPAVDIVIVDIDEPSLAALAGDYGRWPWPRQVLGELVEKLEAQHPRAIVFDILFSDADLFNPDSDAYFNDVLAATGNTWFPLVRLDPAQDRLSQLPVDRVPGVAADVVGPGAPVAVVLPHFSAVQESGRIGYNNIWPDGDGIARNYTVYRTESGFELPSLALQVARAGVPALAPPQNILLNWRGPPFSYRYISFAELFTNLRKERRQRPGDEFTGKTIIIGSTAPSLFDIKATAVANQFPGVEILATAIDNLRRGDWLRVPDFPLLYLALTLAILWGTAWAFYRYGASGKLDRFYGFSQVGLIVIAYAAINLANLYINLTGPVLFGFAYYSLARYYAFATARVLDNSVVTRTTAGSGQARGCLLLLRFELPTSEEAALRKLAAVLQRRCRQAPSAEWLSGRQQGLWRLLDNSLALCWRCEGGEEAEWAAQRAEMRRLAGELPELLGEPPFATLLPASSLKVSQAEGPIDHDQQGWRSLLGAALQAEPGGER